MSTAPSSPDPDGRMPGPDTTLPAPEATLRTIRSLPTRPATTPKEEVTGPEAIGPEATLFDRVGGEDFFVRLVDAFYANVAADDVLRPLYPEEDLGPAAVRLRLFLIQYWGGPTMYSQQRGHPRLRMRHAPFPVGTIQIEHWLTAMRAAIDRVDPAPDIAEELWAYMERSAHFMRNQQD